MDGHLRHGFRLDDRGIYPLAGEIRGPHGVGHLPPKAMDVLLCLAQQQGLVVERSEIKEQVWGDGDVNDDVLARYISLLRHHLADDSNHPRFIKTVPKRGYQLLVPVNVVVPDDATEADEEESDQESLSFSTLIDDLRRRRVFRVTGAYAIGAWVVLQVASTVLPPLDAPNWVMTALVWAAALGFPVVAFLSWTFQVTEKGIVSEDSLAPFGRYFFPLSGRVIDFAIIAILGLIIGFLVYERVIDRSQTPVLMTEDGELTLPTLEPGVIDRFSIAVLPFDNLSADPRIDYLALGLAEDILNLLTNIRELKVSPKDASFVFKGKDIDLAGIAQRLRVRNILDGDLQGQVGDLNISAQLTEADSGDRIWSQSFEHRDIDILSVRDDIARAVVGSLEVALSVESQDRIMRRPTNSPDAYDYYLQALDYLRRPRSEQTLGAAEALFRRALDIDPDYALAYAGLCNVHLGKYRLDRRTDHVEPAEQACSKALSFDPRLAEIHRALGSLYRHTGRYDLAELEFQRAIVLNPSFEPAFYGLAMTYKAQNRLDEAEDIFSYAVRLEPGYWGTHLALGNYYLEYGKPKKAIPFFERVTELNPDYAMGYNNLGAALYNSGDLEGGEAAYLRSLEIAPSELALSNMGSVYYNSGRFDLSVEMYTQAVAMVPNDYRTWGALAYAKLFVPELRHEARPDFQVAIDLGTAALGVNPNDWRALAYVASYHANTGNAEAAMTMLDRAVALGPNDKHVHFFGAITYTALGDFDRALRYLRAAADLGYSAHAIASDPVFTDMRGDERFTALMAAARKRHQ